MKYVYETHRFRSDTLALIDQANRIIEEYLDQGYDLTLRQLYYQMVARAMIPNNQRSYKRLGGHISNARRAGMVDWFAITDRTRNRKSRSHWSDPKQVFDAAINSYYRDRWANQKYRPEVWIEKDALIGVISGVCRELDVPFFACRGYVSDSEMWAAGRRMRRHVMTQKSPQVPIVLHLGDHDPSGIDMTRDIKERLALFAEFPVEVRRLALNMDQVERYGPPPNPTKVTDSRSDEYIDRYGRESWELDALEPATLVQLIRDEVEALRDEEAWSVVEELESQHIEKLEEIAKSVKF